VAKSSDRSDQSGIYVSDCCARRILIFRGVEFPECPDHGSPAEWMLMASVDKIDLDAQGHPLYFWKSLDNRTDAA
jgi:hypothetical protein